MRLGMNRIQASQRQMSGKQRREYDLHASEIVIVGQVIALFVEVDVENGPTEIAGIAPALALFVAAAGFAEDSTNFIAGHPRSELVHPF
jgi:hypothetical protein